MPIANLKDLDLVQNSLQELDEYCKEKGAEFRQIKTAQVRNFFSGIIRLKTLKKNGEKDSVLRNGLIMLRPKLAYAKGRQSRVIGPMYEFFNQAIQSVLDANEEDFEHALENFFFLSEAIVAYHKFYGGE